MRIAAGLTTALLCLIIIGIATSSWVWKADFAVPYTGALILRQGNASRMYDLGCQERVQEALLKRRGLLLDPYPPVHALLFAPLTVLGYRAAYIVWGAINILLWLFFQHLVRPEASRIQPLRFLILSGLFFPLWVALIQGQFSILLLVSFALAFVNLKHRRDWAAGLALGLGLLKFQIVLPFALIFLLRRRWQFIGGLTVAASLLALLSLATVGPVGLASYLNLLTDTFRHPTAWAYVTIKPWNMPTIRGFVSGLLRGHVSAAWITGVSTISATLAVVATAWFWGTEEGVRGIRFNIMFAAGVAVSLLASPYLYPHDLAPIALSAILLVSAVSGERDSPGRLVVIVSISILYLSPLYLAALLGREQMYLLAPVVAGFAVGCAWLAGKSETGRTTHAISAGGHGVVAEETTRRRGLTQLLFMNMRQNFPRAGNSCSSCLSALEGFAVHLSLDVNGEWWWISLWH